MRLRSASSSLTSWTRIRSSPTTVVAAFFGRTDEALRELVRKPSEQLRAQFAFTPFVYEDVGALIRQTDAELYLFSSDYPHQEGGRDPLGRFAKCLDGFDEATHDGFYWKNYERVFGAP